MARGKFRKWWFNHITWYVRQLMPFLTWKTTYTRDGERHFCTWRMFWGRCFDVEDYVIVRREMCYDPDMQA